MQYETVLEFRNNQSNVNSNTFRLLQYLRYKEKSNKYLFG